MKKEIKIAFIADDIRNISEFGVFHNATFGLMIAAQEHKNVKILLTESKNLEIINNKVFAKFDEVVLKQEIGDHLKVKDTAEYCLDNLDIIFVRKDPPVDQSYLSLIQALYLVGNTNRKTNARKPFIINHPAGILKANEKLYALNFPKFIPPTMLTINKDRLLAFLKEHKEAVIKSIFNKGGDGVFYLDSNSLNVNPIIELCTSKGEIVLIQKYLPEVMKGDKRIILLKGEPIGGILRIPKEGEFRAHISRGASFKPLIFSKQDLKICQALKPRLIRDGLYFVAIDIIGDYLIEVNVTCPANLIETGQAVGKPLSKMVIDWAIKKTFVK